MKFLLFADLHYEPGIFLGTTWDTLHQLQKRAEETGCDFMIHAGDFCHGASEVTAEGPVYDFVNAYNDFHIPSYHVFGNHDADNTPFEEMLKYYRLESGYYFFDKGGYRFVVCDPNYFYVNGEYVRYSMCNQYQYQKYINYMPPEQVAWLKETIDSSENPCILISHQSFERVGPDAVQNADQIRQIINEANQRKQNSVLMCINGHYHRDFIRILDNVCYFDMNSTTTDWVNNEHSLYPKELYEKARFLKNNLIYNDPLHAIVTLEGNTITIEGMESSMFMGITREMTDNEPYDNMGRICKPIVQSAKITLG